MNLYTDKPSDYFSSARVEIVEIVEKLSGRFNRVLEIGCGTGDTLAMLKRKGICREVVGVELFPQAALLAAQRVDRVHCLDVERTPIPEAPRSFDLVLALDVLEHLVDPWGALTAWKQWLTPGGRLVLSLPNAQHFSLVLPLLCGEFDYVERGIRDKTHLRFFTKKSALRMITGAGYGVDDMKATSLDARLNSGKLNLLTLGLLRNFLASQYLFVCAPVDG